MSESWAAVAVGVQSHTARAFRNGGVQANGLSLPIPGELMAVCYAMAPQSLAAYKCSGVFAWRATHQQGL